MNKILEQKLRKAIRRIIKEELNEVKLEKSFEYTDLRIFSKVYINFIKKLGLDFKEIEGIPELRRTVSGFMNDFPNTRLKILVKPMLSKKEWDEFEKLVSKELKHSVKIHSMTNYPHREWRNERERYEEEQIVTFIFDN